MIIDIHSHAWKYPDHFGDYFRDQFARAWKAQELDLTVNYGDYQRQSSEVVKTVVFGGKARLSGLWVDDRYVADYVSQHPDDLIGFLSVDPTQAGWKEELEQGHQDLGLRGIKLLSMYAGFRPCDPELDHLWSYATKHELPVLLHTQHAPLECTLPRHLDDVAIRYPDVTIVMAHLSHPYENECVVTVRKHPNVYTDVSAIHYRPWRLYNSLMLVQEYSIWDKVLFGTDYPFATVDNSLQGIRSLNKMVEGTNLPRLDEEETESMIYRDSLSLLNLV